MLHKKQKAVQQGDGASQADSYTRLTRWQTGSTTTAAAVVNGAVRQQPERRTEKATVRGGEEGTLPRHRTRPDNESHGQQNPQKTTVFMNLKSTI